jgi:hypothetical protein
MDLVKSILSQISGGSLDQLCALAGANELTIRTAAAAALPAALAGLAGLASSSEGARRLAEALESIDGARAGSLSGALATGTSGLVVQGRELLASLLGENLLSSIAISVGKFVGLDPSSTKKLLAALTPTLLAMLSRQWHDQGPSLTALSALLAAQQESLAAAMPRDFPLAHIAGLPSVEAPVVP